MTRSTRSIKNRHIQKSRFSGDRKFHDSLVSELFQMPELLKIPDLTGESMIWKKAEYRYLHSLRDREEKGMYERVTGPDLVFFYEDNGRFHFLVVEVKGSFLAKSFYQSDEQMERANRYFRGMWKSE